MTGLASAIYRGRVRHRRFAPRRHDFSYSLFMLYLDLDELPRLFDGRWLWSARRWAPARFRRADYLGDPDRPLAECARDVVEERIGRRPDGPVRLLTHLRYWGYVFNPVSFYYCFETDGSLGAIVSHITNTPWNERHAYVVGPERGATLDKEFHVSPFLPMDHEYHWRFGLPGERLSVHMENRKDGELVFDATLGMHRRPFTGRSLAGALARWPFMTAKVTAGIYWQALRLRLKGCPFHTHPDKRPEAAKA